MKKYIYLIIPFIIILTLIIILPLKKSVFPNMENILVYSEDQKRIYNPSENEKELWYINDHCIIKGSDNKWHLFGITNTYPFDPSKEVNFAHAVSDDLLNLKFEKLPFAMTADLEKYNERILWAPHIIKEDGIYYMFYCAGGKTPKELQIHMAMSKDLYNWTRYENNPIIKDGYDARDPMVIKINGIYHMYYTATSEVSGGNHVVKCITSADLTNWTEPVIVYKDERKGTLGGNCESPFVLFHKGLYFLFIGPRGAMNETHVFISDDPMDFNITHNKIYVGTVWCHAPEVVEYKNQLYITDCLREDGVFISKLNIIQTE